MWMGEKKGKFIFQYLSYNKNIWKLLTVFIKLILISVSDCGFNLLSLDSNTTIQPNPPDIFLFARNVYGH